MSYISRFTPIPREYPVRRGPLSGPLVTIARHVQDFLIGSTVTDGLHWVELQIGDDVSVDEFRIDFKFFLLHVEEPRVGGGPPRYESIDPLSGLHVHGRIDVAVWAYVDDHYLSYEIVPEGNSPGHAVAQKMDAFIALQEKRLWGPISAELMARLRTGEMAEDGTLRLPAVSTAPKGSGSASGAEQRAHKPLPVNTSLEAENLDLTNRELEIAQLLAQGKLKSEIAKILVITPGTLKSHCKNISRKWHLGTTKTEVMQRIARDRFSE